MVTTRDQAARVGGGQPRQQLQMAAVYGLLLLFALQAVYPAVWMVFGSLKSSRELLSTSWQLPTSFLTSNYSQAWRTAELGSSMTNSLIVTVGGLAVLLATTIPAAYALARLAIPGAGIVFVAFLLPMMVPPEATGIPLFLIVKSLGLLDSRLSLMLVYSVSTMPIAIIILRAFFIGLPREVEEAALVDGASRPQILYHIVLPLARPGIATVVIFQGMWMWNEYFLALLLIRSPERNTIALGLVSFFGRFQTDWPQLFAALTIVTIPVVLLYLLMQKQFIAGLTAGATKG